MSAQALDEPPSRVDFTDHSARRRRRRRALLALVAVLLVAGAVWLVFFSSVLAVKSVRVVGVDGVPADQVLEAAAVPVGTPLARLDTARAQAGILGLPWVAGVEVRRGWPNEVVLAITPRVPIAVLAGSTEEVDAAGVTFDAVAGQADGLPTVSAEGVGLETAMDVLASLPEDLAARLVSMSAATRDDVVLTLKSGAVVRWGSAEQADFKAEVLRALLRHKRDAYDVSAPELPTTFKEG